MPPLYCWYGDDFTGSTDVLEQLAGSGVSSVLFLAPPAPAHLARFAHCRAIGLAGDARSRGPQWMSSHLPNAFHALGRLAPRIIHYKVCSTFDSSPRRGSIGRALEIGRERFGTAAVPIVVGAPHLGRYLVFGQLFASAGGEVRRLDRHPAAANHPATPMREADLRLHLARQTALPLGLIDLRAFEAGRCAEEFRAQATAGAAAILLDGCNDVMVEQAGKLLHDLSGDLSEHSRPLFAIGSSGLTAGLIAHWRSAGLLGSPAAIPSGTPAERLLVLSGSCSEATAAQIAWAGNHGYASLRLEAAALAGGSRTAADTAWRGVLAALMSGRDMVLYTALGSPGATTQGEKLGAALGRLLLRIVTEAGIRRVVLCGGDTSSHAVQQLGLTALIFAGRLTAGAPLCRAYAEGPLDGLELVLKGGQVGPENFFAIAKHGRAPV